MLIQLDKLESICDKIITLDSKIRFVGIINDKGKLLTQSKKENVTKLVDLKEQEMLLMEIALVMRMRREHDKHLGPIRVLTYYNDRVTSIVFPLGEDILYISAEKEVDVLKMISQISPFLR